jgi:transcriptional regulator with XRE-family HTH domain
MRERDMRPEELAFRLHISYRTVTRWLAGHNEPTPTMARRLGEFFEVDWRGFYEEAA